MNAQGLLLALPLLFASPTPVFAISEGQTAQEVEQLRTQTRLLSQAGLGQEDALRLMKALEANGVPAGEALRIQGAILNALKEGLPADALLDKALEGLAKHVQTQELVRAVERTQARHAFGRRHALRLAPNSSETDRLGRTIAEALAAGLTEPDAERILERVRLRKLEQQRLMAQECFLTARAMAQYRVGSGMIANTICAALQRAFQAPNMDTLRLRFLEQVRREEAAQVVSRFLLRIQAGQALDDPGLRDGQSAGSGSRQGGSPGSGSDSKGGSDGRGKGAGH